MQVLAELAELVLRELTEFAKPVEQVELIPLLVPRAVVDLMEARLQLATQLRVGKPARQVEQGIRGLGQGLEVVEAPQQDREEAVVAEPPTLLLQEAVPVLWQMSSQILRQ